MLYLLKYLSELNSDILGFFRIFDYITFRTAGATVTSFILVMWLAPFTVRKLKRFRATAANRYEGIFDEKYIDRAKDSTPSMGGILVIGAIVVTGALWARMDNPVAIVLIATLISFSLLGFMDDYAKVVHKNRDGMSERSKLLTQILLASLAVLFLNALPESANVPIQDLYVPFKKTPLWSSPFVMVIEIAAIVGAANAVNFSDGKDGLCAGCVTISTAAYAVIAYLCGHMTFAGYLFLPSIPSAGEALVVAGATIGACAGFLWYNCFPASMFMGDTGSLPLGAMLGLLAVIVRQEILLIVIGFIFVMEAGSVILQRTYFKLTKGKRLFLCTPIHHHFERKDWTETQIVVRFWILSVIFAIIGLATLKLR